MSVRVTSGEEPALFLPDGDRFIPTVLTQGPWRHDLQFGGAAAALLTCVVERVPTRAPMQVARITVDLLRPVPVAPLRAPARVVREGKRIQVVEAVLHHEDVEVARCAALRLRIGDLGTWSSRPAHRLRLCPGCAPRPAGTCTATGRSPASAVRSSSACPTKGRARSQTPPGYGCWFRSSPAMTATAATGPRGRADRPSPAWPWRPTSSVASVTRSRACPSPASTPTSPSMSCAHPATSGCAWPAPDGPAGPAS